MEIREIKDNHWIIDIPEGHITFDMEENKAFFHKKRSSFLKDQLDDTPVREWDFGEDIISGEDVFLVLMKSLHL